MGNKLNRRDFLKIASLSPLLYLVPAKVNDFTFNRQVPKPDNILIVIFDALSAQHLPFYGYQRDTTPNLTRFLNRSTIFHNHYAPAPFTTPSTASLFTGTYSWTHRTLTFGGLPLDSFIDRNIFQLFKHYFRVVYTHNHLVEHLLTNFRQGLDYHKPRQDLYLEDNISKALGGKDYAFFTEVRREILNDYDGVTHSLFLQNLYNRYLEYSTRKFSDEFPRGLMEGEEEFRFILEDAINWLISDISNFPQPFLGYFHFWPPHDPYNTRKEFVDVFVNDDWRPPKKPYHILQTGTSYKMGVERRRRYDEFILYVDAEFKRLYDYLESRELLDNTWLIFTSDHGELFERGFLGHTSHSLHQPVVRIPLIVSAPGQKSRQDVYESTSTVDILPTLLHVTGQPIPEWIEGEILPPYLIKERINERSIFALKASTNGNTKPLKVASTMIVKGNYKLTHYFGYDQLEGVDQIELYDIEEDPEELKNLVDIKTKRAQSLFDELMDVIHRADEPYRK